MDRTVGRYRGDTVTLFIVFTVGFLVGFITFWFVGDWFGNYADFQAGRGAEPSEYQMYKINELLERDPLLMKFKALCQVVKMRNGDIYAALDEAIENERTRDDSEDEKESASAGQEDNQ
jgi:hypothetical protein